MNFKWLKSYMPRSMFGRSLLILLFPVVVLQLVVGMVFIQRHFEEVTTQMTRAVALELNYVADLIDDVPEISEARGTLRTLSKPFNIRMKLLENEAVNPTVRIYFYDLSGKELAATLHREIDRPISIDLTESYRHVYLRIMTDKGVLSAIVPRSRVNASNPHQLLVLMIVTAVILTVISVLFLRNQVRPIRRLAEVSEAFGKGRVEYFRPSGAIEVRRAGNSFLAMRARLERQIEQRTQMLSGVSHDLRTPLTRLKLSLAMMEDTEDTRDMAQDVEDMEKMLNVFLDFARADTLEETEATDPMALVRKLVADCRRMGHVVRYTFNTTTTKTTDIVLSVGAVSRAISNLLTNAIRFGDVVSVDVVVSDNHLRISVEDDGPGIPISERENALKPFVRLDQSRNQNGAGGVGLGLSIAADVARSHGGALVLATSRELGGLKATFTIPR